MPRRWRGNSVFGDGLRSPRDREWLAQWKARIGFLRRAGQLTALQAEIALALARRLGLDGRCDPSHATIAADAAAGSRTVRRALARLSELGVVRWVRRLVRDGSVCSQTSNSYALMLPDSARIGGGHSGRGTRTKVFSSTSAAVARAVKGAVKDGVQAALRSLGATLTGGRQHEPSIERQDAEAYANAQRQLALLDGGSAERIL